MNKWELHRREHLVRSEIVEWGLRCGRSNHKIRLVGEHIILANHDEKAEERMQELGFEKCRCVVVKEMLRSACAATWKAKGWWKTAAETHGGAIPAPVKEWTTASAARRHLRQMRRHYKTSRAVIDRKESALRSAVLRATETRRPGFAVSHKWDEIEGYEGPSRFYLHTYGKPPEQSKVAQDLNWKANPLFLLTLGWIRRPGPKMVGDKLILGRSGERVGFAVIGRTEYYRDPEVLRFGTGLLLRDGEIVETTTLIRGPQDILDAVGGMSVEQLQELQRKLKEAQCLQEQERKAERAGRRR